MSDKKLFIIASFIGYIKNTMHDIVNIYFVTSAEQTKNYGISIVLSNRINFMKNTSFSSSSYRNFHSSDGLIVKWLEKVG